MSLRSRVLLAVVLFLTLVSALPSAAQVVSSIAVEGNRLVSRDRILLTLGLRIGEEPTAQAVREGIRRLYALGDFSDIVLEGERLDDGTLRVFVIVEERPRISEVVVLGNDKVSDSDLRAVIVLKAGSPFDESRLEDSKVAVRGLLERRGFGAGAVEAKSVPTSDSTVRVVFTISEGQRITVKEIVFEGNDSLSAGELKKVMKTKEDRWWRTDAFLDTAVLEQDLREIVARYRAAGHIDAKVAGYDTSHDSTGRRVTVTVRVDEGAQYRVSAVEWTGASDFAAPELDGLSTVKVGAVYDPKSVAETVGAVRSWYGERGYIRARIDTTEEAESEGTLRLRFAVRENEPAHIGQIHITGNTRTKEKIIRRELTVKPGDLYHTSDIIASQRRIANLGFFDDRYLSVHFSDSRTPGDVDLTFNVAERQTGRAGVGISTSQKGVTGFLELTEGNLFGNGQFLNLKWEFGKKTNEIVLGFTEPWFRDRDLTVGFDLYDRDDKRAYSGFSDSFYEKYFADVVSPEELQDILDGDDDGVRYYVVKRERRGGDVRLGWPFMGSRSTMLYVTYTLEQVRQAEYVDVTTDVSDTSGVVIGTSSQKYERWVPKWQWRSGLSTTLVRRTTDRRFHPRLGSHTRLRADLFGGAFGGDVDYQRYVVDSRTHVPAFWGTTLMVRGRAGIVTGYGDPGTVPDDTKFELGGVGADGIRGYRDLSILPVGETLYGGRTMLIGSLELKFPLTKETSDLPIRGVLFIDGGNTWKSVEETAPGAGLYWGVGAGVRVDLPMLGGIGVDMGYGLDEIKGGDWIVHFQFGMEY